VLIFATDVEGEAAMLIERGEAGDVVEAGLLRAAVVVEEGLARW
jgi:hypothetical protein